MPKTATVRARMEPRLKKEAEDVLENLGITSTQAIALFYRQVVIRRGLPFEIAVARPATRKTFERTDAGEGLVVCRDAEDMFRKLGI